MKSAVDSWAEAKDGGQLVAIQATHRSVGRVKRCYFIIWFGGRAVIMDGTNDKLRSSLLAAVSVSIENN